jgi:hypothetical protein
MMAHAGRDPIFWATMAVAEQDFDGSGDLCLRCHATAGWIAGRSTPTDGSGLASGDDDGVECHFCHSMTNPDDSELIGVMNPPFIANDGATSPTGYYGSGMVSLWGGNDKLGPYTDAQATHQFIASEFHRSVDFCGSCHDVSNPAVGDLAHNSGTQAGAPAVVASGALGGPVTGKAAFNNFPYQYGIVERTFSEYKSGQLVQTRVGDYGTLPTELQAGAIQEAYGAVQAAGTGGDYADGAPRYFTGAAVHTLGALVAEPAGTSYESFHFVLNNTVVSDNRIPTRRMRDDDARVRNALPAPADQYGDPGSGGVYDHWDAVTFTPPAGAVRGEVKLLYQSMSWEYIQFLQRANDGSNAFLAGEGDAILEAWLNTGMSAPHTMASATILVPEPGRLAMLAAGLLLLAKLRRGAHGR